MNEFDGETFDAERDGSRLKHQLEAVRTLMLDGEWRTLSEISKLTKDYPEASVSARLRDLRKAKFGGFTVDREYVEKGLWRYRVTAATLDGCPDCCNGTVCVNDTGDPETSQFAVCPTCKGDSRQ